MKTLTKTLGLTMGALLLLTGCQTTGKDSYDDGSVSPAEMGIAPDQAASEEFAPSGDATGNRMDIITGDMYLTVDDVADAAQTITTIVTDAGGRVDSRTDYVDAATNQPSAYLWVRIPAPALDDTLDTISNQGTVERTSISRSDVTLQAIDLAERIQVLNTSLDRLGELLEQATTTSELIDVERAITERQAERDSLVSQQNYLSDQIQFASVSIELRTIQEAPPRDPTSFGDAIVAGWLALVAFAGTSLIALGVALPWLAIAALVSAPAVWFIRRRRKKTKI